MRFSLSSRQNKEYLAQADEVRVEARDIKALVEILMEECPTQDVVLYLPREFDKEFLNDCYKMANGRLKFCLSVPMMNLAKICHDMGWAYYFDTPIHTYEDLRSCKAMGVTEVKLGAPLAFELDKVKAIGIPIRAVPNVANQGDFIKTDGVCGQWIRPENIPQYEEYIDIIEFDKVDLRQEQALFRIYKRQSWMGELGLIIQDLNHTGSNYLIDPSYTERRMNCGQVCESRGTCHICYVMLDLANPKRLEYLKEKET